MNDLNHFYGNGLNLGNSGLVNDSSNSTAAFQRLCRNLFTNPQEVDINGNVIKTGDDPFNPNYGKGIGRFIGKNLTKGDKAAVLSLIQRAVEEEGDFFDLSKFQPEDIALDEKNSTSEFIAIKLKVHLKDSDNVLNTVITP